MFRPAFVFLSLVALFAMGARSARGQVLFEDGLDGASFQNYTEFGSFDVLPVFGYDYSQDGIPSAPNGSDTIGLKVEANTFEGLANEVAFVYENVQLTGQFTVQVDLWLNWALFQDGNGVTLRNGTTEFGGLGIGHTLSLEGRDSASLMLASDGDVSNGYRLYKDRTLQSVDSGQYLIPDPDNLSPELAEAFPALDVAATVPPQNLMGMSDEGSAGFQWMTITAEVDTEAIDAGPENSPGIVTYRVQSAASGNEVVIGTIDNSIADDDAGTLDVVNLEGSVAMIYGDIFSSVSPSQIHSFGVFDNLIITGGIEPPAGITGDYNNNGQVEQGDLDLVLLNWGVDGTTPPMNWINDLPDGQIDQGELDRVLLNWGSTGALARGAAVPEPASWLLGMLGMILIAGYRCSRGHWHGRV